MGYVGISSHRPGTPQSSLTTPTLVRHNAPMNSSRHPRRLSLLAIGLVFLLLLSAVLGAASDVVWAQWRCSQAAEGGESCYAGIVGSDGFRPWLPASAPRGTLLRLTSIHMQEARSPESGELDLRPYEGRLILLQGRDGGGWLYSARLIRTFGP